MLTILSRLEALLPGSVKVALSNLSVEKQAEFEREFAAKAKDPMITLLLAVVLGGWNLVYLGKIGLAILFWITIGGFGVWYIVEIMIMHKRVDMHNSEHANRILQSITSVNI